MYNGHSFNPFSSQLLTDSWNIVVFFYCTYIRLHRIVQEKEAVHETLVSPDKLAAVSAELALFQQDNKRLTNTHRQLLIRYAALKFMIDGAFKKLDDMSEQQGAHKPCFFFVWSQTNQSAVRFNADDMYLLQYCRCPSCGTRQDPKQNAGDHGRLQSHEALAAEKTGNSAEDCQ